MHLHRFGSAFARWLTLCSFLFSALWMPVAQAAGMSETDYQTALYMLQGDIRYTRNDVGAIIANIPPGKLANTLYLTFSKRPQIYARYHPESASGRIDVVTLRKLPNGGVEMQIRPWAPKDGSKWARNRYGDGKPIPGNFRGLNPFRAFYADGSCAVVDYMGATSDNWKEPWDRFTNTNPTCDEWRNLAPSAFFTAVGMAMKYHRTDEALVGVAETRVQQGTRTSGNVLKKKTTTYVDAYVKPHWYRGAPLGQGGTSMSAAYCVVASDPSKPCPKDLAVDAGVNFVDWNKGDLSTAEYHAFHHEESKSGLTFVSFIVVSFALAWAGGFALTGVAGMTGTAATAAAGTIASSTAAATWGAAAYGLAASGLYAGLSMAITGNTSLPLTTVQDGYLGEINNGVINSPPSGSVWDPTPAVKGSYMQPNQAAVPGPTGQVYQDEHYQAGDWQNPQDAYQLKRQRDQGMIMQTAPGAN
ncbi:hypothetical protein BUE93_20440 [Chromobacterium amazonense]|uniref:Uncharacterized protein n=1 Tax=Chromobacterium amazonense TaxID=1382803 RepID=A0A2S9WZC4_9NEIS|nr:hypothetical protein [Chromobacterium amazonense]PRP68818.1 hypothetical protein BUE93_20440 [Chromobacterium amazonense]